MPPLPGVSDQSTGRSRYLRVSPLPSLEPDQPTSKLVHLSSNSGPLTPSRTARPRSPQLLHSPTASHSHHFYASLTRSQCKSAHHVPERDREIPERTVRLETKRGFEVIIRVRPLLPEEPQPVEGEYREIHVPAGRKDEVSHPPPLTHSLYQVWVRDAYYTSQTG